MTLSATALETAAKAMHGAEPWSSFWSTDDARLLATAAITAYLAQAGKEGWVMVPAEPTEAMIEGLVSHGFVQEFAADDYRAMLAAAQNGGGVSDGEMHLP